MRELFLYVIIRSKGCLIMDTSFLFAAIAVMLIVIAGDYIKKRYNFDVDNIDGEELKNNIKTEIGFVKQSRSTIDKSTGRRRLVLVTCGDNKATVMATLRQITGLDYNSAKHVVDSAPVMVMKNISDREAILNKRALEFVGAKCEIR